MCASLISLLNQCNAFLWNGPMLLLLCGTHLYFTCRFRPQRFTFGAIRLSLHPHSLSSGSKDEKGMSAFGTLATTLAATLGTGNIVGVSTAIALGGPGALFWCFLTGLFGMATTYAECYLSCLYCQRDEDGSKTGGPMYVLKHAFPFPKIGGILAAFYAFCVICAAIGTGCTTQSSAIADAARSAFFASPHIIGMGAAMLTGLVIIGGKKRISRFCTSLIPPLTFLYLAACLLILWKNRACLLPACTLIFSSAFSGKAAAGGLAGSGLLMAARFGIARGLFTNEAGIGTAAIAAGSSSEEDPCRQAFISMTAVFWDTIVMCSLTGLVIISSLLAHPGSDAGYSAGGLTQAAFSFLPFGSPFLTLTLMAFAFATLVGWCYLGERGILCLFGKEALKSYHLLYIVMIYLGAILPMDLIWSFADFINALMAIPNILALFFLASRITPPRSAKRSVRLFPHRV